MSIKSLMVAGLLRALLRPVAALLEHALIMSSESLLNLNVTGCWALCSRLRARVMYVVSFLAIGYSNLKFLMAAL